MAKIDITPHAYNMMEALRSQGYTDPQAIADLCDNSIEAGATFINIKIEGGGSKKAGPRDKVSRIFIADDGTGMDSDTIDSVIIVGKMRKHGKNGLGKYGQGTKAASLSMGRELTAYSKTAKKDDPYLVCNYDHDQMKRNNSFKNGATVRNMTAEERVWFDELTENSTHGTILEISNLDYIGIKTVETFVNNLKLYLSHIFREIKIAIDVNGESVEKEDYLLRNEGIIDITKTVLDKYNSIKGMDALDFTKTHKILDKTKIFSRKRGTKSVKVRLCLCIVPQWPSNSPKPLKRQAGWSLLRCNREIKRGLRWGIAADTHHEQALLRGELRVMADADDFFRVNSSKQSVHPPDWFSEEIAEFVKPYTSWARKYRNYLQSLGEANQPKWWDAHAGQKERRGINIPSVVKSTTGLTSPIKEEKQADIFRKKIVNVKKHKRGLGRGTDRTANARAATAVLVTPKIKIKREIMAKKVVARIDESADGMLIVRVNKKHKRAKWLIDRLS